MRTNIGSVLSVNGIDDFRLDELTSITDAGRGINALVKRLATRSLRKAVVVKNNRPEAIMLNVDDYIELKRKEQALELMEINLIVQKRGRVAQPNTMSMEEMFAKSRASRKRT